MNDNAAQYQTSQTVGGQLRNARERKKLTQEELATMLHLQIYIIQALENDQFDQLAAPTYTKGYIRSYARHVELDGDELIQLYETGAPATSSPEILPKVSKHTQVSSTDKPVKIMTYLISLGLVLLLLIWWQSEFIVSPVKNQTGSMAQSAGGPYPGGFNYTYDIVTHPDGPFYKAPDEPVTDSAAEELDNDRTALTDIPPILDISETVDSISTTQAPIEESADSTSPVFDSILILEVSADSWIEVRDGNREKLYLNLAKSGEVIFLDGELPITVVLGNAEGVKVTWKGNHFDIAPYSSAGVARFKLEE